MSTITEREPRAPGVLSGETCEATWTFLGIEASCGDRAIGRFRRSCVHEHVRDGWLCREHAERRDGLCLTCWDLPDGLSHECPIDLTEVTA